MKKLSSILSFSLVVFVLAVSSCKSKKDSDPKPTTIAKPNDQQGSTEADAAVDDVNDFINNKVGGGSSFRVSAYNLPCGIVKIDSSTTNTYGYKVYKFVYGESTPCGYKKKSGITTFSLTNASTFDQTGAIYTINFINYVVEDLVNGTIVTLNGTLIITNVNGGYIYQTITNSATIVHKVRGTFAITYADGVTRNRSYFQRRTYASTGGWAGFSLTASGDTTINMATIYEMGNTYEGNYPYNTEAVSDFIWSNCGTTFAGPYVLKSGHVKLNYTVPFVSPTYLDIEAGYHTDASGSTLVNDCTTNSYKITNVFGATSVPSYQLY